MGVVSPIPQLQVVPEMSMVIGVESARTKVAERRTANATASFTFILVLPRLVWLLPALVCPLRGAVSHWTIGRYRCAVQMGLQIRANYVQLSSHSTFRVRCVFRPWPQLVVK